MLNHVIVEERKLSRRIMLGIVVTLLIVSSLGLTLDIHSSTQKSRSRVSEASSLPASLVLLDGGVRWASRNGSSVLFINWKDNWIAHHLTDGINWGPWPSESFMDGSRLAVAYVLGESGFDVQFAGDIPENLSSYDLVILEAYFAVEPRHAPIIQDYLNNGGGVVILQGAAPHLAVYSKCWRTTNNISSIQKWFGASVYENTGGHAFVTVDKPLGTSLLTGDTLVKDIGYSCAAITLLHTDAQKLAQWQTEETFAFAHEYGQGRIYYQAWFETLEPSIENASTTPPTPTYNDDVVVSAVIKNATVVDQAFLSYGIAGMWQNLSMTGFGNLFNATIPSMPYGTLVEYKIYANDTFGNWFSSLTYSYTVSDPIPPHIATVQWTPAKPGANETVDVSANITEPVNASGVRAVLFSFIDCFGQWWNTTMTYDGQSGLWSVTVPQQPHNTTVKFYLIAYDNAGNAAVGNNLGEYYSYIVLPEFSSFMILLVIPVFTTLAAIITKRKLR